MAHAMAYFLALLMMNMLMMCAVREAAAEQLKVDYYKKTCPSAEKIVRDVVRNATAHDPKAPARILRMHFHDCFIRGCDGSVLLDSTANNTAEKDGPPNVSLRAFYVIDDAKSRLESACPRTVSCADIVAIAARDVVELTGGPRWEVEKGRRDGVVSRAVETRDLPAPTFNLSVMKRAFAKRGLSEKDIVALSGGHTLGFSHCSSFEARLRSFNKSHSIDPSIHLPFANSLMSLCPQHNSNSSAGAFLDSTPTRFDNAYFRNLLDGKGVFHSDQALWAESRNGSVRQLVYKFAKDEKAFFSAFSRSMVRMGRVGVLTGKEGEVRLRCRFINSDF